MGLLLPKFDIVPFAGPVRHPRGRRRRLRPERQLRAGEEVRDTAAAVRVTEEGAEKGDAEALEIKGLCPVWKLDRVILSKLLCQRNAGTIAGGQHFVGGGLGDTMRSCCLYPSWVSHSLSLSQS